MSGHLRVPANWKRNTFVLGAAVFGITCVIWKISAEKEQFAHRPEPERFYPSRGFVFPEISTLLFVTWKLMVRETDSWNRQLINWQKEDKLKAEQKSE
ncbi:unnamed protein product [Parascedosporium putredinis]|uniref:Uncharacterized protein n=1 Tax=Parascedosporium putredinis TaxID=1442378 RepID=A0A9P1MBL9_9PEZI|nr:unnamed protein product [Parascedosporium putredinis]CAI7996455.1 unnamed protein product [Parascedosporium putredinis]